MTDEPFLPTSSGPDPAGTPDNTPDSAQQEPPNRASAEFLETPAETLPRIRRRARKLTPPDAPGFPEIANLNAAEPPHHFRELLQAVHDNFRPRNKFATALAVQSARALWSMRRVDESMAMAVDVETDTSWTDVDGEFEDVDNRLRAFLATGQLAQRPISRLQLAQGNFALRSLALATRLLTAKRKPD